MSVADITITSLELITAFDILTGNFKFQMDELQKASIAQSQDETEITGKQGRRLSTLKKNKAVTISGTNGLVSTGLLELQTGSSFTSKATDVMWYETLAITNDAATTTFKAVGTSGAEIESLFIKNSDGTLGVQLEQAATASAGKFAYAPATKILTFLADAYEDGQEIYVCYKRHIQANVMDNLSDHYSEKCALYIDALGEDKCANVYRVQIFIPKADFNGEFTIDMGDAQTVHEFTAMSLAGACGGASSLWTYTVFGANAEDVNE